MKTCADPAAEILSKLGFVDFMSDLVCNLDQIQCGFKSMLSRKSKVSWSCEKESESRIRNAEISARLCTNRVGGRWR